MLNCCPGHWIEVIASIAEGEIPGDTLAQISEGEQAGARIRELGGIGTRYQIQKTETPTATGGED